MIGNPVRLTAEENVVKGVGGIAAVSHFFESRKALFASTAGIIQFNVRVVADIREVVGIEEGSVVGELSGLIAVAEAAGLVADVAGKGNSFAGRQGLFQGVNGVEVARRGTDKVERPIKLEVADRLPQICNVDLLDRLVRLILERDAHVPVERAAVWVNVDGGIDRGDLGLQKVFVLFELAFVIGLDVTALESRYSLSTWVL